MANERKGYYFAQWRQDVFDHTGWRIIDGIGQPTRGYCKDIYTMILTESVRSGGVLMRDEAHPYTKDQLMDLCGFPKQAKELRKAGMKAYRKLIAEKIIEEDGNGVIRIVDRYDIFGYVSADALKKRRQRSRATDVPKGHDRDSKGDIVPSHVPTMSPNGTDEKGQDGDKRNSPKLNDNSFLNSSKQVNRSIAGGQTPADEMSEEFLGTYPKKCDGKSLAKEFERMKISRVEFTALMAAARRLASDPNKLQQNGRFCKPAAEYVRSRPWTPEDLEAAEMIEAGREMDRKAEEEEAKANAPQENERRINELERRRMELSMKGVLDPVDVEEDRRLGLEIDSIINGRSKP